MSGEPRHATAGSGSDGIWSGAGRLPLAGIPAALCAHLGGPAPGAPRRVRVVWLDTWDWRLFRRGLVLERRLEEGGARVRHCWRRVAGAPVPEAGRAAAVVEAAEALGARVLLPAAEVECEVTAARVEVPDRPGEGPAAGAAPGAGAGAPIARPGPAPSLVVEAWQPCAAREPGAGGWIHLSAAAGAGALAEVARAWLAAAGLVPAAIDPLVPFAAAAGRIPGAYSGKPVVPLAPTVRADTASRHVLGALARVLRENERGVVDDVDPEFLHDFRVAVRATRAVLGQFKGAFPAARVRRFREGFAWLQQVTGPVRDADVLLLQLAEHRTALPPALRPGLDPLETALRARRAEARAGLLAALASRRYRGLLESWERFLDAPPPARTRLPDAARPVAAVLAERLARLEARALREAHAAGAGAVPEALHELRKTFKKLRYLLELFRSLLPGDEVRKLLRPLRRAQDVLGALQDLAVQRAALPDLAGAAAAPGGGVGDGPDDLALEVLEALLRHREAEHRARVPRTLAAYTRPKARRRAARLAAALEVGLAPDPS